jgi:endoglucanase
MAFSTCICLATIALFLSVAASAQPDAFALWERGAFRGANVMLDRANVEDLGVLRSWGANLAEIPVLNVYDPAPPYAFRPENLAALDAAVKAAEEVGLYVVLTCREGPGRADFNRSSEIWREAAAQDAYVRMWRDIGSHYRGRASIVGYDLMCEPHPEGEKDQPLGDWNALAKRITEAIREVDKQTPIIVNSIGWAYPQEFDSLQLTGDPRTVYEVHFYDPHYYTHQKPEDKRAYPGFRLPWEQDLIWDKAAIEARLAPVRAFQEKHHVPVFAGEFGCARYAAGAEQWLRDQMDFYEKDGWSWAYWAFREWDVMNIERTADPADKENHADTPLLRLFKGYFAKDKDFLKPQGPPSGGGGGGPLM